MTFRPTTPRKFPTKQHNQSPPRPPTRLPPKNLPAPLMRKTKRNGEHEMGRARRSARAASVPRVFSGHEGANVLSMFCRAILYFVCMVALAAPASAKDV